MKLRHILPQLTLLVACLAFPLPSLADPGTGTVVQSSVNDAQAATGNGEWGASRLKGHDRIVVQAPEVTSTPGTYGVCKSIVSNDNNDIFVPWNSPTEWSDFLSAVGSGSLQNYSISSCCTPMTASVCGTDTGVQMGYRQLGTVLDSKAPTGKPLDATLLSKYDADNTYLQHYGGQGDVYGPVYASQATGNSNINYEVTYVCSSGTWIKTHEIGSCVPLNGACNSPGTMTSLPSDITTLCGAGSLIENLTATSTGWTWECAGTPGMSNAQCAAYSNPPVNATCGPLATDAPGTPMYTLAQISSLNPSLLCSSGTLDPAGFENQNNYLTYWVFACDGSNGGANVQCYANDYNVNGNCGSDNGTTVPQGMSPSNVSWCSIWGEQPTNLTFTNGTWTWTCDGINGPSSGTCSATMDASSVIGNCGLDNNGVFTTLSSTDPNLCSAGGVSAFTSFGTGWSWACVGAGAFGTTSSCIAGNVPAQPGSCGIDNGQTFAASPLSPTDPYLCFVGSPEYFNFNSASNPQTYTWACTGVGADGGSPMNCTAYGNNGPVNGACGTANGYPSLVTPTANLCSTGTWTSVTADGSNINWLWSCQGSNGGTSANCSAPIADPDVNGTCGTANGTAIPNTPNFNLCATGNPSVVSGTGPWTWTCLGTGNGTSSGTCKAQLCQACQGTTTFSQSGNTQAETGVCKASGTTSWTETDALIPGSASNGTISWTDEMGSFSQTVRYSSAPWPTYCSPCYQQIQSASNVKIKITSKAGVCPFSNGATLTPTSGPNVTVP